METSAATTLHSNSRFPTAQNPPPCGGFYFARNDRVKYISATARLKPRLFKARSCIAIFFEPIRRAAKRAIHRGDFPSQFALGFGGAYEHLFTAHADGIDGSARFAAEDASGDEFID